MDNIIQITIAIILALILLPIILMIGMFLFFWILPFIPVVIAYAISEYMFNGEYMFGFLAVGGFIGACIWSWLNEPRETEDY